MAELRFSPESFRDLRDIRDYIAEELFNPTAAEKTVSEILENIQMLSRFPQSGAPLSAVIGIETDYRFLVCGSYMAFYRVEGGTVYVVRILYGRRNYMELLFGAQN